jgi:hypothetical protein
LLNYTDKGIRKLLENAGAWTEKVLADVEICRYFQVIAEKARKDWKQDNKTLLDELDSRLRGFMGEEIQSQVVGRRKRVAAK